ncbi:ferrous iron transport protein B [Peptoniphilus sp. oral taxon 386]|uniref:ferrous iron transport protein B n=1 Tax=Peptoniphilus sp. oral taxon 386 TaxID=652713 RepID=UPI0001DA9A87|nr:ferrous iron transport protein B [Peptoniphilus sp. oral taxon 386]EFI41953.1 ferrous iron transport protein B [Peptoniphilus sp. oral taxon 386 str. F0131]
MTITIALAGNPNSGKTTLFNALTGSHQYVGNWPGVTVEKKTGEYKKNRDIKFTDLPGIYSLSPYTLEEVVSRDYLLNEHPDVIIDVIDASNIERNLYLATQLSELGIPIILALNMMDVVKKNNDIIDTEKLEKLLNCKVVEISALKNFNLDYLIKVATDEVENRNNVSEIKAFSENVEGYISEIENSINSIRNNPAKRWIAIKLFERDLKISSEISITDTEKEKIEKIISGAETELDDDGEGIITDERYNFVTEIVSQTVKKGREGLTVSDKIDKIVTNRFLALPIFAVIMYGIYYLAITIVGGPVTDWTNEVLFGEIVGGNASAALESIGVAEWLNSLITEGIIGGVGGVLGFLPIIATLFLLISILEDVGYMARIAFILDRIFRKFGLSGKSFIPILMGTGCSVPGIMGTRTIENDNDRRMTITVASFMPCGAKTEIIAMFAAVLGGHAWYGPIWYFGGIVAVIISGLILKKTNKFHGDPAPFVMELPEYHMPSIRNITKATLNRCKAFIIKAGTIILLCTVVIWFLKNISVNFEFREFADSSTDSILSFIGKKLQWIFAPLGFGNWMATVATILGLVAKEVVVGTYGVVAGLGEVAADDPGLLGVINANFTTVSILSFMFFNQLTLPCFAAMGAIKEEMGDNKWFGFAIGYQMLFSYTIALMIYQFGRVIEGEPFTAWTAVASIILVIYLYLLFRPNKYESKKTEVRRSVEEA